MASGVIPELPARTARQAAGYTTRDAARLLRVSVSYLLRCEREGDFPHVLATRAAQLYRSKMEVFLPHPGRRLPQHGSLRGAGARRTPRPLGRDHRR